MRWPLRPRQRGRLPSLGQDYGEAHRRYVERLGAGGERWLRTKPFSAPPGHELRECLRTFAHIVEQLRLDVRAQVLDVGCGPGWLSEYLSRCGYWVTGIDVSEDMIEIARERIASISRPIAEGLEAFAEFHVMPVVEMPWSGRFDAAILYDAMHHFDDEVETLRVIRRTLVPGGRIFIHEGVRPMEGSEGERELIEEMQAYGTLESPFDPEYLEAVLGQAGFEDVTRFAAIDALLDVSEKALELERLGTLLEHPPMNTVIAVNAVTPELSRDGQAFLAEIDASRPWQETADGHVLSLTITVRNAGRAFWPNGSGGSLPTGTVTVGSYVPGEREPRSELARAMLPRPLASGESDDVELRIPRSDLRGTQGVAIDLVREGLAWFGEYGSPPVVVPLPSED
jgi:SAM-dependent methyltransferase